MTWLLDSNLTWDLLFTTVLNKLEVSSSHSVMKKHPLLVCLIILSILSCKKSPLPAPDPVADFELALNMATQNVTLTPLNRSKNAIAYLWDLGDGTTSTQETPTFELTTIGNHKISLTVKNADGKTSITSRNIRIVAPILTSITIKDLQKWQGINSSSLKKFSGGKVWVEIREYDTSKSYAYFEGGYYDYPLFYKSAVVNVPATTTQPILISIDDVMIDRDLKDNKRYVFHLYVSDAAGQHMLFTSDWIGSSYLDVYTTNSYLWRSGFGNTQVEINGRYY